MPEVPKAMQRSGRTRWVTGVVFIVLSVAIWARMGWLVAFYSAAFGRDEWIRLGFWLWAGALLALVGLWLAYRSRVAVWVAGLIFVGFIIGVSLHDYWLR